MDKTWSGQWHGLGPMLDACIGQAAPLESTLSDSRMQRYRLDHAYRHIPLSIAGQVLCALALAGALAGSVSSLVLFSWTAAVGLASGIRYLLMRIYLTRGRAASLRRWRRVFVSGVMAEGVLWGALALMPFPASGELAVQGHQLCIAGAVAVVAATAVITLSALPAVCAGFFALVLVPASARFLAEGTPAHLALAAALGVFGIVMYFLMHGASRLTDRCAGLQLENLSLRHELSQAQSAAKSLRHDAQRTLATVSHELRTPLGAMVSAVDLVASTELETGQRRLLDIVSRAAHSLLRMLDQVLDHSKMNSGSFQLERAPFSPREVIEHVIGLASSRAHAKRIELVCDIDPRLPEQVEGDGQRLQQVLTNLVSNAIKFTPHGEVVVTLDMSNSGGDDVALAFRIRDTGVGLSAEESIRVFEPYHQATAAGSGGQGGTGLGLSICRHLVREMGGRLEVRSAPGKGSTFGFTAVFKPVATDAAPAADEGPLQGAAGGLRVLVVDASSAARRALARTLTGLGAEVHQATSLPRAVQTLRAAAPGLGRFDLALMNADLLELEGGRFERLLAADPRLGEVHWVKLTSGLEADAASAAQPASMRSLERPARACDLRQCLLESMSLETRRGARGERRPDLKAVPGAVCCGSEA